MVSVDNLGWDGFGVACFCPHLLPESIVLGDIHQLVLDVLPIEDSSYFALLGFDLEAGWEKAGYRELERSPKGGHTPQHASHAPQGPRGSVLRCGDTQHGRVDSGEKGDGAE